MVRRWVILAASCFSVFIFSFAQVHIKERVEIKPKKISGRTSQNVNAREFPCLSVTWMPQPYAQGTGITVLAPCSLQISGTYHIDGNANICDVLSLDGYALVGTVNENLGCDQSLLIDMLSGCPCGGYPTVNPAISQTNTSITGYVDAQWCCIYPRFVHVTWSFQVIAIPFASLSVDSMTTSNYPSTIEACDLNTYTSDVCAYLVNTSGPPFQYCGTVPMQFTIENPIPGLSLNGNGTTAITGDIGGSGSVNLCWDGSDLPSDEYNVKVLAESSGFSAEQQVTLKKVPPCYFSVVPASATISMGQTDVLTITAMDHKGNEVRFDGNKLVTLIDGTSGGCFIVDSNTIKGEITVPYSKARNGGVQYLF